jgi:hypothetical protein
MPPNVDASLYWLDEYAELSFSRVCQYLMTRGLETADDIPATHTEAFITASQGRPKERRAKSRSAPGRLWVVHSPISDQAVAHGDHPAIEITWADQADQHSDERAKYLTLMGKRDYRFFVDLCENLSPLYANLTGEGWASCAYDALHGDLNLIGHTFFCQDALLGGDAPAFWATYAYTERVGTGRYGTDYLPWSPRKWSADNRVIKTPSSTLTLRTTLLLPALKRVYRELRRQGYSR